MRFVDREQARFRALEQIERLRLEQTFRRNIEKPQLAAFEVLAHRAVLEGVIGRIQRRGGNAVAAQLRDLVAHQRDQRRHHDGEAAARQSRELVAQRLAAAGRHHGEHVAAFENGFDDLGLTGPKCRKTESFAKNILCRSYVGHRLDSAGS